MATELKPGDIVRLNVPCNPVQETDEDKVTHFIAEEMGKHQVTSLGLKPPWMLFGSVTGVYIGPTRLKLRDKRATRGVIRRHFHRFMFGTKEVMIEHHHVDVFISYKELLAAAQDDDVDS